MQISEPIKQKMISNEPSASLQSQQLRHWLFRPKNSKFGTKRDKKFNDQHWNSQENHKYAQFLVQYRHLLDASPAQKRKYHLNRMMSKAIGTRSQTQCRSHHQQMMKCFRNVDNIIKEMERNLKDSKESISQTADARLEPIETVSEMGYQELRNKHVRWTTEGASFFNDGSFSPGIESLQQRQGQDSYLIDDFLN